MPAFSLLFISTSLARSGDSDREDYDYPAGDQLLAKFESHQYQTVVDQTDHGAQLFFALIPRLMAAIPRALAIDRPSAPGPDIRRSYEGIHHLPLGLALSAGRFFSRVRKFLAKSNIISRLRIEVCGRFERRTSNAFLNSPRLQFADVAQRALDVRPRPSEIWRMPATCFDTSIGSCAIAWKAAEITGFSLPPATNSQERPSPWVDAIIARVKRHLAGEMQDFADLPYAWNRVSSFQRAVYEAALQVKPGQTWSYGQLAAAIAQPTEAARAVGAALGQNPWPLLVPCHRFIGADGRMTGFSAPGGIKMKLRLLALEGAELFPE